MQHTIQPMQVLQNGQCKNIEQFSIIYASHASADQSECCDCGQHVRYIRCMQCNLLFYFIKHCIACITYVR